MDASHGTQPIEPGITGQLLRQVAGRFATGVTILTIRYGDVTRGITINSFTSISLDPPLVLVSIDNRARSGELLRQAGSFALSILAADQQEWSDRYAGRFGDLHEKFDDVPHVASPSGAPYLLGALGTLHCRVTNVYPGGDHALFLALVEEASVATIDDPLLFYRGRYTRLVPTAAPPA